MIRFLISLLRATIRKWTCVFVLMKVCLNNFHTVRNGTVMCKQRNIYCFFFPPQHCSSCKWNFPISFFVTGTTNSRDITNWTSWPHKMLKLENSVVHMLAFSWALNDHFCAQLIFMFETTRCEVDRCLFNHPRTCSK